MKKERFTPAILILLGVVGMALALSGCGTTEPTALPSPSPSPVAPPIVYDVHVFAFSGKSVSPSNAITDVDQGSQFKVGLTVEAYDTATGKLAPDAVPPIKVQWRQTNVPVGLCSDRGALDSIVEQEVCWESTGIDKATFEGCARSILDDKQIGCATYGVTVR